MENAVFFILIILGIIILAALLFFSDRKSKSPEDDAAADYAAGLNYLVTGDLPLALKKLTEAVRRDTSNVDAYIKIGDILRDMGNVDQAIKVHRDLTARTSVAPTQRVQILRSLVNDYETKRRYDLALKVIQQILELKANDLWTLEKELHLYEVMAEWEQAANAYRDLGKLKGKVEKSRLALYRVQIGKQHAGNGREKEARVAYRDAIKIFPRCSAAYLELSDSYLRESRPKDALEALKDFVKKSPEKASIAFERIKELLFAIGEFGEIENIYSEVISDHPENWHTYLQLAELKEKKGEIDRAIDLCQQILQRNPDFAPAREHLVRYYHRTGKDLLAVEQALALLNTQSNSEETYKCERCGYEDKEPYWYCPSCNQWETVPGL